jgi:hypothetical protein
MSYELRATATTDNPRDGCVMGAPSKLRLGGDFLPPGLYNVALSRTTCFASFALPSRALRLKSFGPFRIQPLFGQGCPWRKRKARGPKKEKAQRPPPSLNLKATSYVLPATR